MKNFSKTKKNILIAIICLLSISFVNAQTWVHADNGNVGADISSFYVTADKIYASSEAGGIFVTDSDPINWSDLNGNIPSTLINSVFLMDTTLLAGSYGSGVFKSTDHGTTWAPIDSGFQQGITYVNVFNQLNGYLFVGTYDGAYVSTDTGSHWTSMGALGLSIVYAFEVKGTTIYAGSSFGMKKSIDSGATWAEINNGLPNGAARHVVSSGNRIICAVYQHHVYASTDSGATWVQSSSGIPNAANVTALYADGNTVYAGTDSYGIYRSTDNGTTWSDYSFGQQFDIVSAFCKSNGILYAGTDVDGILKLDNLSNGISSISTSSIHLFPNPAHDDIFIHDDLNEVKEIKIFDAVGKCVMTSSMSGSAMKKISVQSFSPGIYTAIVNGTAMMFEKY